MRVWFDAPSAGDLLFLEPAAARAGRRHEVLFTVSGDPAALAAGRIRGIDARRAGRRPPPAAAAGGRAGGSRAARRASLEARVSRLGALSRTASRFGPDLVVSASSVEAARVAFGLGVPHVAFGLDEPPDDEIVRLTAPLVQKMIVPRRAAAAPFTRRGLAASDLLRFDGTAASVTAARRPAAPSGGAALRGLETAVPRGAVLARPPARGGARWARAVAGAARSAARGSSAPPPGIAVVARPGQAAGLRAALGPAARIIPEWRYDGMLLIGRCGALVGAAGSAMAEEASLSGVPAAEYGGGQAGSPGRRPARPAASVAASAGSAAALRAWFAALQPGGRRQRRRAQTRAAGGPLAALARAAQAATGRSL